MEPVVAYMRYSTEDQSEYSIEYQRTAIQNYCAQNDMEIVREYIDEGYSGRSDKRPDFQTMVHDSKAKPVWKKILVHDTSRYFRNIRLAMNYLKLFEDRGIEVFSVTQKFGKDDSGYTMQAFSFLMDEGHSRKTSGAAHAGMKEKANKAGHCGGRPPLGYDVDTEGNLVINEEEAEIVKKIFDMVEQGYSYTQMAKLLNAAGHKTKKENDFNKHSFCEILHREKYMGVYTWNVVKAKNSDLCRNSHAYKEIEDQVRIEDGCPQIITPKQFQRVQDILAARARGKDEPKARRHYMLSGMKILKCAECGSTLVGVQRTSHKKKYTVYACPKHKGQGCSTTEIPTKYLDDMVGNLLAKDLYDRTDLDKISRKMNDTQESKKLAEKHRKVKKAIDNVTKAIKVDYSETLIKELKKLENEEVSLARAIAACHMNKVGVTKENRKEVCRKFCTYIRKADDPEVKQYLTAAVKEILVSNEGVTIKLNIA